MNRKKKKEKLSLKKEGVFNGNDNGIQEQIQLECVLGEEVNVYLSIIFPIRIDKDREYILPRLQNLLPQLPKGDKFEFLFVDSGSRESYSDQIKEICQGENFRYIYQDTKGDIFSIGKARDFGVQHAKGQFIMFQDVDLIGKTTFYDDIVNEIKSLEMESYIQEFFIVPCFYLTQEGSLRFLESEDGDLRFRKLVHLYHEGESNYKDTILNLAPSTSIMVFSKLHYLSLGGHRTEFYGHGCEDYDLLYRAASLSKKYQKPDDIYLNKRNYESIEWEGFRAWFSMWGYQSFFNGLILAHIWHPRPVGPSLYGRARINETILDKTLRNYDKDEEGLSSLINNFSKQKTLLLGIKGGNNTKLGRRQIIPLFGEICCKIEGAFAKDNTIDLKTFHQFYKDGNFTKVCLFNPYSSLWRLDIYNFLRENNIPYIVHERGALPDSWFFDKNGFNADSTTYDIKNWDKKLNSEQIDLIQNYITNLTQSEQALESQRNRIGSSGIRNILIQKYGITGKKILFYTVQRPMDVVVRFFSKNVKDFNGFCNIVDELYNRINKEKWIIICKKHPLEKQRPNVNQNLIFLDDLHINDILSVADRVLLLNSGVGVLSMLFEKPVCYLGDVFYNHPKINYEAKNVDDILDFLESDFKCSYEHILRFIHYLKTKVYSFGRTEYKIEDNARFGLLQHIHTIEFSEIRGIDDKEYFWKYREKPVQWNSRVYGLFLASIIRRHKEKSGVLKPSPKPASKPVPPKPVPAPKPNPIVPEVKTEDMKARKVRKFKYNRYQFFADAKNPFVRSLKVFCKKNK